MKVQPGSLKGSIFTCLGFLAAMSLPLCAQTVSETLTFNYALGGNAPPPQTVDFTSGTAGQTLAITQSEASFGGFNWLSVTSSSPTSPAVLTVTVTPGMLPAGVYSGSIIVQNSSAATVVAVFFTISATAPPIGGGPPAPLQITGSGSLGEFLTGSGISGTMVASGGQAPYTWSATGLPLGFNLNSSSGAFSGAAPAPGVYSFTLTVTDSEPTPATATVPISFSVLGIVTSSLPAGSTTSPYSQTIVAIGGTLPYAFSGSGMPPGLSLSAAGLLSGTPSAAGSFGFIVQVKDSTGLSTSSNLRLVVAGPPSQLTVPGGQLSPGNAGTPYSVNLTATGGTSPYTWTIAGGALPDGGVSLSSSGSIAGTPKTPGTYIFTAQAKDTNGLTASGTFTIAIGAAALQLTSVSSFPVGIATTAYPEQILSATGGVAPYNFSISSGALPPGLTFASPKISGTPTSAGTFDFALAVTDSAGSTASAPASITIDPFAATLILSQTTIPFSLAVGSSGVPSPASVTVQSTEVMQILNYSVAVTPAAPWLDVTTGSGSTPGSVGIALDPSALSLGASTYQATIEVICVAPSPCAGTARTITVSLTVIALAPQLTLNSSLIAFSALTANPVPESQTLGIQNTGGGTVDILSVTPADTWLTVSGVPFTLAAGPAAPMTLIASPEGLRANFYRSTITVVSPAGTTIVPVTLSLTQSPTMTLNPAGTTIQSVAGNPPGNLTGSFSISVNGPGTINWASTVQPGASWLSVTTPSGPASAASPGMVSFAIDPTISAGLSAQAYTGSIQITSGDVVDSPLIFQVFLNVNRAGTSPAPLPGSSGLVYTSTVGASSSQAIPVYVSSTTAVSYQASATTGNGASWLTVSPSIGLASAASPGQSVISTNAVGVLPGIYRGSVSYAFSSDAERTVNVTLLVKPSSSPSTSICAPSKLVLTQTGLVDNFALPVGWPTRLAANVMDDCGSAVPGAQVVVAFSSTDQPFILGSINNSTETFVGTWTPVSVSSQLTVSMQASAVGLSAGSSSVTGTVIPNSLPILAVNTPTNVWNPLIGGSLAPGTIIQVYGSNLAAQAVQSTAPLSTNLGNTSVLIGGIPAPIYYVSPEQVNVQIPFELAPGNQYQLIVDVNGVFSMPSSLQLTAVAPGIATYPLTGQLLTQHADYSLVTEASPATPGEYVTFYLTGLGGTDNPVATGAPSPSSPLSHPLVPLTLTFNGSPVPTAFVGLTPTVVGLYQVNFQIPVGTSLGDLPLVVSQSGSQSNTALLSVQH